MSKAKKIGVILILVGICLPLVSLGFVSNYHPSLGIIENIQGMKIVLRHETDKLSVGTNEFGYSKRDAYNELRRRGYSDEEIINTIKAKKPSSTLKKEEEDPIEGGRIIKEENTYSLEDFKIIPEKAIAYKYIFVLSVFLVFTGIVIIVLSSNKQDRIKQ